MKLLPTRYSLLAVCSLFLVAAPVVQAASAPRNTADWIQEHASRVIDRQVRVQVAMVKSLGVSPDGLQQSFLATTYAKGEAGGTIVVLIDADRGAAFQKKFGTTLELDGKGKVKTKRLDAVGRLSPNEGKVILLAS